MFRRTIPHAQVKQIKYHKKDILYLLRELLRLLFSLAQQFKT